MQESVLSILRGIRDDVDYEREEALVTGEIFDSMDIVMLVNELRTEYNIDIGVLDMVPENFDSLGRIEALVGRKMSN